MARRKRRVPRYLRETAEWQAADAERRTGIPRDAIPADLSQQAPNNSYGGRFYYQDHEFTCVDCGIPQVWTAERQKWWYEVAKGSIYSGAKRCRACRAALRAAHRGAPRRSQAERNRETDVETRAALRHPVDDPDGSGEAFDLDRSRLDKEWG